MEESFEDKLLKVELLEIYDEVADIEVVPKEVAQLCTAFTCKVNLQKGNLVYAVEKKYKSKLEKYKPSKRLKWLRVHLKDIIPNPEEKFLRWQRRHDENKRLKWLIRKLHSLDYFWDQSANIITTEEPCASSASLQSISKRCFRRLTNESCSTAGNTSSESVQTVIASQPRHTRESSVDDKDNDNSSIIFDFKDVSRSSASSSSGELPSLCLEDAILPNGNEAQSVERVTAKPHATLPMRITHRRAVLPLLQESEWGVSSQEDAYVTFYQDMQVTSTQEFG